ncbi:Guanine nucleotide-binding protein alpha-2 subunit [Marasmius tenuissimus]|uniref:Guanine nucleotide-binding protein alpha-2 subunit n=1 Tax=Marasmius tenuissimus TaxID=585030 RepID=A0ABR2ZE35_9AGAR
MDGSSDLSSLYSSISSSTRTTVLGLGYLSGKAIKRLGEVVLNGVDNVFVNRQLGRIEASVKTDDAWYQDTPSLEVKEMCRILLELSHPGFPFSTRMRAMRVIMALIGSMSFIGLATVLVDLGSTSKLQRHLCDVLDCLWDSKSSENARKREAGDEATRKKIFKLRAAGYESYVAASPQAHTSTLLLSSPFILYLALVATLGSGSHTRLILSQELNIVRFLRSIGLFDNEKTDIGIMAGRLFMQVLRLRLNPITDESLTGVVENAISELFPSPESITDHIWPQFERSFMDSPSQTFLTNLVAIVKHQLVANGTQASQHHDRDGLGLRDVKVLLLGGGCGGKTTIMKQLILAHHRPTAFTGLYDAESYFEMMERQLKTFLQRMIDRHRFLGDHTNPPWARYDIYTIINNFQKLTPLWSSSKPLSEKLLELHDFVQTNITSFADMCSVLPSTDFVMDIGHEGFDAPLDYFGTLLEALRDMANRSRRHTTTLKLARLEPTHQNLLGWYVRTIGAYRNSFTIQGNQYVYWDCGGQRPERKKWVHYYHQVDVVVFVVSLIEYNRVLLEDHSVILVFNQMDLLADKLESSPLQNHFPDYDEGPDTNAACEYIKNQFLKHVSPEQNVTVHFMSALDPKDVDGESLATSHQAENSMIFSSSLWEAPSAIYYIQYHDQSHSPDL